MSITIDGFLAKFNATTAFGWVRLIGNDLDVHKDIFPIVTITNHDEVIAEGLAMQPRPDVEKNFSGNCLGLGFCLNLPTSIYNLNKPIKIKASASFKDIKVPLKIHPSTNLLIRFLSLTDEQQYMFIKSIQDTPVVISTIAEETTDLVRLPKPQACDPSKNLSIKQHNIISKHNRPKIALALPTDFEIDQGDAIDTLDKSSVSPYAFDYKTKEFILTKNDKSIIEKPFFYQAQFEDASSIITLPLALASSHYGPYTKALKPTFIFSIGRCGSTLMTKLTNCIGKCAVSEPDIFSTFSLNKRELDTKQADQVLFYTLTSLECFFGIPSNQLVVKLRTNSNSSVSEVYRNFPNAKYIFMIRDVRPWCKSFIQKFNWKKEKLYQTLTHAINALEFFKKNNINIHIIPYEDLIARPEHFLSILLNEDESASKINTTLLADIMSKHSQSGTGLENKSVDNSTAIEARVTQFMDFWQQNKPVKKLQYLNIDL